LKLSVCITTYNHEEYIAQALDSVLMQQTEFDFEILVGEDQSDDATRDIVISYRDRCPNLRLFLHNYPPDYQRVNGRANFFNNMENSVGQYIALLDGDDYWTDPLKLQKQVDFLDAHPDCSAVYHKADVVENGTIRPGGCGIKVIKDFITTDDLLEHSNFIPTCSVMFRREVMDQMPEWVNISPYGDLPTQILNSLRGPIAFLNESMAARRIHQKGMFSGKSQVRQILNNYITFEIMSFHLNFYDNPYYQSYISRMLTQLEELTREPAALNDAMMLLDEKRESYKTYPSIVVLSNQLMKKKANPQDAPR